jgi:hypothetical protein
LAHLLKCAWIATLATAALCLLFALGKAAPVIEAAFYWIAIVPLAFLYSIGVDVGKLDGGWLVPSSFGYGILAVAVWLISFAIALITRRD